MGHCIQVIVAPMATADKICRDWPELSRLNQENGFAILPMEANSIDQRIAPAMTPGSTGDEFMLLTAAFCGLLRNLSQGGQLAYIETEYIGRVGGQGAAVFLNGVEIMSPTWGTSGTINHALRLIGLKRHLFQDEFEAAGFGRVRDNDGLYELIADQAEQK